MGLPSTIAGFATATLGIYDQMFMSRDKYTINSKNLVSFNPINNCKKPVTGVLSEALHLEGKANWENWMKSVPGMDNIFNLANAGSQLIGGLSLVQPWFSRKIWKGTDPFSIQVPFNLVAFTNPKEEVWEPCLALLSYLYPRESGAGGDEVPANSSSGKMGLTDAVKNLGKSIANSTFITPGPNVFHLDDSNLKGDLITVQIGSIVSFNACYITQVSIDLLPTLDSEGYPLGAKCKVTIESQDCSTVGANGSFTLSGIGNNAGNLPKVVDACKALGDAIGA